jgi:uncharacterized protein YgiM (DUF1202 family)
VNRSLKSSLGARTSLIVVIVLLIVLFTPVMASAQEYPTAVIRTDALNVRSGAGPAYSVVATVYYGEYVYLLGRDSASLWVYVRLGDNVTEGWLNSKYIHAAVDISTLPLLAEAENSAIVLAYTLNIRSGPDVAYPVVGTVTQLNFVQMLERNNDGTWVKIRTSSGVVGWAHIAWLSPLSSVSSLSQATDVAAVPAGTENLARVTAYALNVRSGPDVAYPPVAIVYAREYVTLLGRDSQGLWVKVMTATGTQGWVHTAWLYTTGIDIMALPDVTPVYTYQ